MAIKTISALKKWWKIYSFVGIAIGIVMINFAAYLLSTKPNAAIILFVFSLIQISMSVFDVVRNPAKNNQNRIFQHINKMGGGLIAATTAFAAVNITFLPTLVVWLAPSIIGTILITRATGRIKKMRKKSLLKSDSTKL